VWGWNESLHFVPLTPGTRWMELQLAVNLLLLAHYFRLEMSPANFKLRFNPFPSLKPSKKLKFVVSEQRHELPS